jgi:hypothetical protein
MMLERRGRVDDDRPESMGSASLTHPMLAEDRSWRYVE